MGEASRGGGERGGEVEGEVGAEDASAWGGARLVAVGSKCG